MKFLIIDDEPLIRRSLCRILRAKKHEVQEAEDGQQGLEMWRTFHPDVIFLDVLMPKMSGPEVIEKMRGKKIGKVILMSAFAGEHNMETALEMGADLFMPKPFEDIFSVVDTAEKLLKEGQ